MIYAANVAEDDIADDGANNQYVQAVREYAAKQNSEVFVICAQIEEEISELDEDERKMFLEDLGLTESGLEKLVRARGKILDRNGVVLADNKSVCTISFIKAEVVNYQDLLDCGSYAGAREKGLVRMEGKEYVVQDGDVILFRFNV